VTRLVGVQERKLTTGHQRSDRVTDVGLTAFQKNRQVLNRQGRALTQLENETAPRVRRQTAPFSGGKGQCFQFGPQITGLRVVFFQGA
jgi:hypothetical protein